MSQFDLSLPDEMTAFIDAQVSQGGFATASDYLQELIRREQVRLAEAELDAKLLEGLKSKRVDMTDADWDALLEETLQNIAKKTAA
jgi:antitoxin ParD1/3/4